MAYVLKSIYNFYSYANDELSDPRVSEWPLMRNPLVQLVTVLLYLILVLEWGPKWMERRQPFELKSALIVFNITQVMASSYLFYISFSRCYLGQYNILCEPVDFTDSPTSLRIAEFMYYYHLIKIVDLLDTFFFVLRKKQNQVSFLHVYHHGGMVILTWLYAKFLPGGHSVFYGCINSFVHMCMYSYYLLTSLDEGYKKSIWWKKHITQLQLIQFLAVFLHFVSLSLNSCGYPKCIIIVMIPQNLFMFVLFFDFYYKTYLKRSSAPGAATTSIRDLNPPVVSHSSNMTNTTSNNTTTTAATTSSKYTSDNRIKNMHSE